MPQDSPYEPSTKRSDCWLKLKKDYLASMGDSLDLVPVGGWRGCGRKSRWVSPWLMATFDPEEGTFGTVCRVMSGLSDQFYRESTIRYLGRLLEVKEGKNDESSLQEAGVDEEGDDAFAASDASGAAGSGAETADDEQGVAGATRVVQPGRALLLSGPAPGVDTRESPPFWFEPVEVWEIRGADVTVSPKHMAGRGLVHPNRGLSLRFPRFIRKRTDKRIADATTPEQLAAIFRKQTQQQ